MATTDTAAPTIGDGRYGLVCRLGEGCQAAVYRVVDRRLGVHRALKVLLPRFASKPRVRARFASEARAMARLEHPHVVRVYDVEPEAPLPYLVMELLPNGSLADRVLRCGPLPVAQAVDVAIQICEGVAAAHAAGIVHRDVKPHNVLVGPDGTCKLTDFGIARMEDGNRTKTGASMGTRGYMAPEQQRDASAVTERCDVYGVGMTLFVLVAGLEPTEWVTGAGRSRVPPALRSVLEGATAPEPEDRIPTAVALAEALRRVLPLLPATATVALDESPLGTDPDAPDGYGFPEIGPVLDQPTTPPSANRSPDSERRRATPYVMWRPTPAEKHLSTPDYVDRESKRDAAPRSSFVIGLDEADKRRTQQARQRRTSERAPDRPAEPTAAQPAPAAPPRPAIDPRPLILRLAAVAALGAALLLGVGGAATHLASSARAEVRDARARLHVGIDRDRQVIDDLVGLGADRSALEAMFAAWHEAREPARSEAAVALIDRLERELGQVEVRGYDVNDATRDEIARLVAVRDQYTERAARGPLAVLMGR